MYTETYNNSDVHTYARIPGSSGCAHEGVCLILCIILTIFLVCARICQNEGTRSESTCTCDCADGYDGNSCESEFNHRLLVQILPLTIEYT